MNNCMNCGAMLLEGVAVCPVCQQPTAPAQGGGGWSPQQQHQQQRAAPSSIPPWPQHPPPYGTPPGTSNNKTGFNVAVVIAIGLLLLVIVGVVGGALYFIKSRRPTAVNDNDNRRYPRASATPYNSATPTPSPTPPGTRSANNSRAPISGGVLNGKATSLPKPAYPALAQATRAAGTVTVQVTIDESGNVTSARAVSGHPLLQQAAVQAARQAKFSPTKLAGQPVKVTGVLNYNFVPE